MSDVITYMLNSEAFHVLASVSAFVAASYELYLRRVTSRATHGPVLSAELQASFEKLQVKWATRKAER